MAKTAALCDICGKIAKHQCRLCGKHVCSKHFDAPLAICHACKVGRTIK